MSIINYDLLNENIEKYRVDFEGGIFGYVVIDGFLNKSVVQDILDELPDPNSCNINKSRDYVFAKNKFEKSEFYDFGNSLSALFKDLISSEFSDILKKITGENVFVDSSFHGGGIHQGGEGSFLDMHADFNYHPIKDKWFRNLNILVYLNPDWEKEYGGELQLTNKNTGKKAAIEPILNRCVIMHTRDYTLHGYNKINFPSGTFRRSIAAYAYTQVDHTEDVRSTTWYPNDAGIFKSLLGRHWPKIVKIKNIFFGSSTGKNK